VDDPIEINRRNWDERAAIHSRDAFGDMLGRFRAGEDALLAMEAAELGDISGKRVLHLQCHVGRDTLSRDAARSSLGSISRPRRSSAHGAFPLRAG
jgi:hypothetical protein